MPSETREIRQILDAVRSIVQALRVASRACEKGHGLSGAQLFVLQSLGDTEGISVNEVAERTHTHQSSVSEVVSRLVAEGLVERRASPRDGRRAELFLTPRGRSVLGRAPEAPQQQLVRSLERMAPRDRARLAGLLGEMVSGAGLGASQPPMLFEPEATRKKGKTYVRQESRN